MNPAIFTLLAWEKENESRRLAQTWSKKPYGFLFNNRALVIRKKSATSAHAKNEDPSPCGCV